MISKVSMQSFNGLNGYTSQDLSKALIDKHQDPQSSVYEQQIREAAVNLTGEEIYAAFEDFNEYKEGQKLSIRA